MRDASGGIKARAARARQCINQSSCSSSECAAAVGHTNELLPLGGRRNVDMCENCWYVGKMLAGS